MQTSPFYNSQNFLEIRFPTNISYGATGGPAFSTNVLTSHAGHEWRQPNWNIALAKYNVAHGVKTEAQLAELISFFRLCCGRAKGFRFKDWMDYKVEKQVLIIADGKQKVFPLYKKYSVRQDVWSMRRINKPVHGSLILKLDNIKVWDDDYEVDYNQGLITFETPPSEGEELLVSFEFDVPVRFDTDHLAASIDSFAIYSWNEIPLVEVRVS
ncbi:MAG: DUF2460 domain-containing protein [Proteobacteria bacterium]|nr:DUF2460 domain-containing protein [Pseudomonadota bacterium]